MSQAQEMKTTRRSRFPQPHATYKTGSTANIPTRNVLVESRRPPKHVSLRKQEEWCRIVFDDRSSSDIGQTEEWCETLFGCFADE